MIGWRVDWLLGIETCLQKKLKRKQARQQRLIAPKSKFLPMDDYLVQFGNPRSAENKARGHRVTDLVQWRSASKYAP